eukprot:TRINITY_DN489_c5_g1_i1.p1 TRINITY_DN489_c5_g1~~TRINITY_DN489_c5_g1_i1.p1  ORF type:complete len:1110 (+),score=222.31 TRINITY_DN489_c5_g1_i1:69-3398(+)
MPSLPPPPCRSADSAAPSERVQVAVRVRPLVQYERGSQCCLDVDEKGSCVEVRGRGHRFRYDFVFGGESTQVDVYEESVAPLVAAWLDGINCCVFAYGMTGSGKTFTMLGDGGGLDKALPLDGVIPMVADSVFRWAQREEVDFANLVGARLSQYEVRASYCEVYNDQVRDLLLKADPKTPPRSLEVREDAEGRVYVKDLQEHRVTSLQDVLGLIEQGSRRRATGCHNLNEHSSRSHAIFTLILEHRWRAPSEKDPRRFRSRMSRFNLVDLAGSECAKRTGSTGDRMREGISINIGLLALSNVIAALSSRGEGRSAADHIPYRDSVLTRLLQSSLCGEARTLMIACVSPADVNRDETTGTLKYARIAGAVRTAPRVRVRDVEAEADPMDGDVEDFDRALDRRLLCLDTPLGQVYARCCGKPTDELLLYVHGSGPRNSSAWWNGLIFELAARAEGESVPRLRSFYHVAIDCPGYGRSPGDRQEIRSSPGALIAGVIAALGKPQALCLIGSSQGACAVFNAALERPKCCEFIAVMDPVGHDVFRYKQIKQPALVIFDTEDDGHPVKVGRWMRDSLPTCYYHEFAASRQPYWHCDNMAVEMLSMFRKHARPADGARAAAETLQSGLARLAGGLRAWCEAVAAEAPIKQLRAGLVDPPSVWVEKLQSAVLGADWTDEYRDADGTAGRRESANPRELRLRREAARLSRVAEDLCVRITLAGGEPHPAPEALGDAGADATAAHGAALEWKQGLEAQLADLKGRGESLWRAAVDEDTGRVYYYQEGAGDGSVAVNACWQLPPGAEVAAQDFPRAGSGSWAGPPQCPQDDLFSHPSSSYYEEETEEKRREREDKERAQTQCDGECAGLLWRPVRLDPCRHVLCLPCARQTVRYNAECPACGQRAEGYPRELREDEEHQRSLAASHSAEDVSRLQQRVDDIDCARDAEFRLVLEYGNTDSAPDGGQDVSRSVEAFVRIVRAERGRRCKQKWPSGTSPSTWIQRVDFDINPDYPKAAIRVSSPGPFLLSRTMSTRFPVYMTVHWQQSLNLPPLTILHNIQHGEAVFARRIAVVLPAVQMDKPRRGKVQPVVFCPWTVAGERPTRRHLKLGDSRVYLAPQQ